MGVYTEYATYVIYFHDRAEYEYAVIASGGTFETGGQFDGSPQDAAAAFAIPYPFPSGNMDDIPKGVYYIAPYVPPYEPYGPASPTGVFLTDAVDSIEVPPLTSTFGTVGVTWTLRWKGIILYMQGGTEASELTAMTARRWIGGFEIGASSGEGGTPYTENAGSRDASRTIDGIGLGIRGGNVAINWVRSPTEYTGGTVQSSWERFYFRLRNQGTGVDSRVIFWKCNCSVTGGAALCINKTTPTLELCKWTHPANAETVIATQAIEINTWYKIDVQFVFPSSGGGTGRCLVFINGVLSSLQYSAASGDGIAAVGYHINSSIGKGFNHNFAGNDDSTIEYDIDDWVNMALPTPLPAFLETMDWNMGSHVRSAPILAGTAVGYAPIAPQIANQIIQPMNTTNSQLVSTTSGALIEGLVDLPPLGVQDKVGEVALGCVAAVISAFSQNATTDGQLGYNAAGAGDVMATILEVGSPGSFKSVLYRPSGLIEPIEINPFLVRYTKSADANSATVKAVAGAFEYIGIWGPEDCIDPSLFPQDMPRTDHLHNCPYPNSVFGYMGPEPDALAVAVGGTYVGNGTEQHINLPYPCNFLIIRALTGGTSGVTWWSTMMGPHSGISSNIRPTPRIWMDSIGQVKFTVTGTWAETNASGVTYQYIAFCDPGMRFCVSDAYAVYTNAASRIHNLQNPDFTPEFALFMIEGGILSTVGLYARGPGNTLFAVSKFDGNPALANCAELGPGTVTTKAGLHTANNSQSSFIAFRSTEPDCGYVMCQILTYTGNAAGSRVITLTPTSGRFPLFVLVVGTGGLPYFRDPSHTGANSAVFGTLSNSTTAITAMGRDSITVGSTINTNGVVYNVFCIPGDEVAVVNGVFFPPNCESGGYYTPPMDPPEVAILGDGGIQLNGVVPLTLVKDISGIYTMVADKTNDTLYDRQTGQANIDVEIPDPTAKTGFIGG